MGNNVKDMIAKFKKLDKFEGNDFRRWQKKMHFVLTTLKVVYVLSNPMPEFVEDETLEQTKKRCKWENDDYICRGHILNGMSDALFDVHQNVGSTKELWDQLKSKYMAEDASSKKFLVSNFNIYKMVDSSIIDKLPPSWKEFKYTLKRNKDELSLDNVFARWIDLGATCHACKDPCWFDTFHLVQDESVLHMGDESTKPILGHENVVLEFSFGKSINLVNVVYGSGLRNNLCVRPHAK
nr:zinc finger, CCHC-type [Tanacetum cinerariifolium]